MSSPYRQPGLRRILRKYQPSHRVGHRTVHRTIHKGDCIYFCRFGRCHKGPACPFFHNPTKVAVCTRFLRGTCRDGNCLFSHKTIPEKTPVCEYFLRGICSRDPCPYRHVNVGRTASICQKFAQFGQCYEKQCRSHHISLCPDFAKTGTCPKKNCCLRHCRLFQTKAGKRKQTKVETPADMDNGKDFIPIAEGRTLDPDVADV